jgi:dihydrofolate synthase/folylpolyglutamate synthase
LRRLSPLADNLILTRPESERALSPAMILQVARQYHQDVVMTERPEEALRMALADAGPSDLICVTGSLYLIGAVKRFIAEKTTRCNHDI